MLDNEKCIITVYPAFVSKSNQLSHVDDVFNAITVRGDAIGDVMFYGRGAGKLPTASAVVADIIDCVKHLKARKYLSWDDGDSSYVADYKQDTVRVYVHIKSNVERNIAKANAEKLFGEIKLLGRNGEEPNELAFITPYSSEETLLSQLKNLSDCEIVSTLRLLD